MALAVQKRRFTVDESERMDANLWSAPEPDVVLLRPRSDFYASRHAGPADVFLVIEVAESSIAFDREIKAPLYARSEMHEYWLVDLNENALHCYSWPERGTYRNVQRYQRGQSLAPLLLPDCVVSTSDLIPE